MTPTLLSAVRGISQFEILPGKVNKIALWFANTNTHFENCSSRLSFLVKMKRSQCQKDLQGSRLLCPHSSTYMLVFGIWITPWLLRRFWFCLLKQIPRRDCLSIMWAVRDRLWRLRLRVNQIGSGLLNIPTLGLKWLQRKAPPVTTKSSFVAKVIEANVLQHQSLRSRYRAVRAT